MFINLTPALSEQKLQRNLVLVNDLLKSKGSVANCMADRACVHTGNASEQVSAPQQNTNSCSHCIGATLETERKPIRYSVNIALRQIGLFKLQDGGFSQIIHSNVYKRKQLQSTFSGKKIKSSMGNI